VDWLNEEAIEEILAEDLGLEALEAATVVIPEEAAKATVE
jgi:hypothetical protein